MSNKAVFLDRDGTLIYDPGYINNPDQVRLLDGVAEALIELKAMGYKLVVVSNQSAIARGMLTENVLAKIHDRMKKLLAGKGAFLDNIYYCPYHSEGAVKQYRKESNLRKPNHGMLTKASVEMDISLEQSWMIGDSDRDIEAGLNAGCKTILLDNPAHKKMSQPDSPEPDYKAVNIREAVNIIKKQDRSGREIKEPFKLVPKQTLTDNQGQKHPDHITMKIQPAEQNSGDAKGDDKTEHLLGNILDQLRKTQRVDMFGEFSIMRLLAGVIQIFVLFCLLISVWFLMNPAKQYNSIFISLGFAIVLQLMALTFYIMQERK